MPEMKHESNGHRIDVKPDMTAMYESQGWGEVAHAKSAKTAHAEKSSKPRPPVKGNSK